MTSVSVDPWIAPWMDDAICVDYPSDWWFPAEKSLPSKNNKKAIEICQQCPVQVACLQYAFNTDDRFGIFGGLYPHERYELIHDKPVRKDSRWLR